MMQNALGIFKAKLHSMAAMNTLDWDAMAAVLKLRQPLLGKPLGGLGNNENYFIFVVSGLLRETDLNNFGEPCISRYLTAGSVCIAIDPHSSISLEPINDTCLLVLSESDVHQLEASYLAFRRHFKLFLNEYIMHWRLRGDILAIKPGKLRYHRFYELYPDVCRYQTLQEQASFLSLDKDTVCELRGRYYPGT